nr:probable glycosyltransferase At5g25310 [Nicotiana tomentosiformis]
MCFIFAWGGWEGAAHDNRIFSEALRRPELNFLHPSGDKYYLVDAGYSHIKGYMAPYKGHNVRYHLAEFRRGATRQLRAPNGHKEMFNYLYSSCRNIVERTFGVWKVRRCILRDMPFYHIDTQRDIVLATMAIHNYIRKKCKVDNAFQEAENERYVLRVDPDIGRSTRVNVGDKENVENQGDNNIWMYPLISYNDVHYQLLQGTYILKEHEELIRNTIKALCNADISEGIFKAGKDVSLLETAIRNVQNPLRNLGGNRVSQRPILAFFAGNMHGPVRPKLLQYWSDRDEDMRIYGPLPNRVSRIMSYHEHMKSSKYCLCPMGFEVNSPRIVEEIYYECVPMIIADNLALPFDEVLDWSAFSVVVAEKYIPKLKEILLSIPLRWYLVMQNNVKRLQKHFYWNSIPTRYDLFHMILHSIWTSRLKQLQVSQIS